MATNNSTIANATANTTAQVLFLPFVAEEAFLAEELGLAACVICVHICYSMYYYFGVCNRY